MGRAVSCHHYRSYRFITMQCPHPVPWGEAKRISIVKEHCMARKTACHVLQITSDQNQEVLDLSPEFGISFFSERIFGSGISSASTAATAPIPANVSGGSNDMRECMRRA